MKIKHFSYKKDTKNDATEVISSNLNAFYKLTTNLSFIPKQIFDFFCNNFFSDFFAGEICRKNFVYQQFAYVTCERNKGFKYDKFGEIKITNIEFNFTFSLDKNDLFISKGNNVYFLFAWKFNGGNNVELGWTFMKKWSFYFDVDGKSIGLLEKEMGKGLEIGKVALIILLTLLIFIFVYIWNKYLKSKFTKKIRANEMDDQYEYHLNKRTDKEIELNSNKDLIGV